MFEKFKDNLFSTLFTAVVSIISTCMFFYLQSQPTSSEEIKTELTNATKTYIENKYKVEVNNLDVEKYVFEDVDLGAEKTIFFFGSFSDAEQSLYRWIAIYEKEEPNLANKILGKDGFYKIKSFAKFQTPYPETMLFNEINTIDINKDGQQEVHVRFTSIWASGRGVSPLIIIKDENGIWRYIGLPALENIVKMSPDHSLKTAARPFTHFGAKDSTEEKAEKTIEELKEMNVYGHDWKLESYDNNIVFSSLRNGGGYFFTNHPIKGYFQILWVSFFKDGNSTLGKHYAVVRVFKHEKNKLIVDDLWNWGEPVFSGIQLDPTELDVNSLYKAGLLSHLGGDNGELFFGFTEYEKVSVPDGYGQINGTKLHEQN